MNRYLDFDHVVRQDGARVGPVLAVTTRGTALAGRALAGGGGSLVFPGGAHAFLVDGAPLYRIKGILEDPGNYAGSGEAPLFLPGPVVVPGASVELALALPEGWRAPGGS